MEFPMKFDSCPICETGKGLIRSMAEELGPLTEDANPGFLTQVELPGLITSALVTPRKRVMVYLQDICENCGAIWCKNINIIEVVNTEQKLPPGLRQI